MEKESMLVLCGKMHKLRDTSMFSKPAQDWNSFMSNKILIPGEIDFDKLQIDKKSPIYREDFIKSLTKPLFKDDIITYI